MWLDSLLRFKRVSYRNLKLRAKKVKNIVGLVDLNQYLSQRTLSDTNYSMKYKKMLKWDADESMTSTLSNP